MKKNRGLAFLHYTDTAVCEESTQVPRALVISVETGETLPVAVRAVAGEL